MIKNELYEINYNKNFISIKNIDEKKEEGDKKKKFSFNLLPKPLNKEKIIKKDKPIIKEIRKKDIYKIDMEMINKEKIMKRKLYYSKSYRNDYPLIKSTDYKKIKIDDMISREVMGLVKEEEGMVIEHEYDLKDLMKVNELINQEIESIKYIRIQKELDMNANDYDDEMMKLIDEIQKKKEFEIKLLNKNYNELIISLKLNNKDSKVYIEFLQERKELNITLNLLFKKFEEKNIEKENLKKLRLLEQIEIKSRS